jgi:hypothetical protein
MDEQIEVNAVAMDRYEKLTALVKNRHKDNLKPEHLAELRRFFDEDPELWRRTGNMARRRWTTCHGLLIHSLLMCKNASAVA